MSTATIYVLLSNDGEEDLVLTSDSLLSKRLRDIKAANEQKKASMIMQGIKPPNESTTAKISDITATHLLWVHRRFYPYVAMAHTFYVTQVYSGSASLASGGSVQFDMEYAGEFYNKACVHAVFSQGSILQNGGAGADAQYWAWAPMLGHRWCLDTEYRVNTNSLDKYDNNFMESHFQFCVDKDRKDGYRRCVGQEVNETAKINQFESVITPTGGVLGALGWDEYPVLRRGPQTRAIQHDAVEMFIPLWFWWNHASEESFCTLNVPNGQRIIKINLNTLSQMVQFYDKNGAPIPYNAALWNQAPVLSTIELYVQNIYVNPDINDVYIDRIGFNMVRLHRYQAIVLNSTTFNERLNNLKWPTEEIRVAVQPNENQNYVLTNPGTYTSICLEDCWTYGVVSPTVLNMAGRWNSIVAGSAQTTAVARVFYNILTSLTVQTQGLKLYDAFPARFFECFTSTAFAEEKGRTVPEAPGWYLINLNAKPGSPYASGHINISRSRETFLAGTTQRLGTGAPAPSSAEATMQVQGMALNFTFVTNGNIIIRFIG